MKPPEERLQAIQEALDEYLTDPEVFSQDDILTLARAVLEALLDKTTRAAIQEQVGLDLFIENNQDIITQALPPEEAAVLKCTANKIREETEPEILRAMQKTEQGLIEKGLLARTTRGQTQGSPDKGERADAACTPRPPRSFGDLDESHRRFICQVVDRVFPASGNMVPSLVTGFLAGLATTPGLQARVSPLGMRLSSARDLDELDMAVLALVVVLLGCTPGCDSSTLLSALDSELCRLGAEPSLREDLQRAVKEITANG